MTNRTRGLLAPLAGLASLLAPSVSEAYSNPKLFAVPSYEGGGGGRYYTGSRSDGHGCDTCHGGGAPLDLEVYGLPQGGWAPGATYTVDIAWSPTIEHAAVLAEFTDLDGSALGELTLAPQDQLSTAERCGSGTRAASIFAPENQNNPDAPRELVAVGDCGAHRLRVQWRAPEDLDRGELSVHIAGVRGDGSDDASGDGVWIERYRVPVLGTSPATPGCSVGDGVRGGAGPVGVGATLFLLSLVAGTRARRRQTGLSVPTVLAVALALGVPVGCARVHPWERGRLAQPDMALELDADLLAGPGHAVEYREGSAGALGGAGGGCGCN